MPLVNYPIECSSCRGLGDVKPACAFDFNRKLLAIECLNCRGKGTVDNMVYVNPPEEQSIENKPLSNEVMPSNALFDFMASSGNEEVDKASKAIKKVKSKKFDLNDSIGSTKIDYNDAC